MDMDSKQQMEWIRNWMILKILGGMHLLLYPTRKKKKILRNPKAKQRNIKQYGYGKVNVLNVKQHKV